MVVTHLAIATLALFTWNGPRTTPLMQATTAAELAQEQLWRLFPSATEMRQDPRWGYLQALGSLSRGDRDAARRICTELVEQHSSAPAYLLAEFLSVHADPQAPSTSAPPVWRDNPSLRRCERVLRWSRQRLGSTLSEFAGVLRVEHYGNWPTPLLDLGRFVTSEPQSPTERLHWLNQGRNSLLARLTGVSPQTPSSAEGRRWVLVTLLRPEDVARQVTWVRRLGECLGDGVVATPSGGGIPWVVLWVLAVAPGDDGAWRREIQQVSLPLFVAVTQSTRHFQQLGFERGGISILLDPGRQVRMVSDRWLPLPVLSAVIGRAMIDNR